MVWFEREETTAMNDETSVLKTYIAMTPVGGIPAMTQDDPPSVDCDIYRIVSPYGQPAIEAVGTKRVHNLFDHAIAGNEWIPVVGDKWDCWFPVLVMESAKMG